MGKARRAELLWLLTRTAVTAGGEDEALGRVHCRERGDEHWGKSMARDAEEGELRYA